ncbi:MAG TPA: hypothetical protein VL946_00990, partial [Lacibacter sp.]|nr:hypothetical protein [Lacibacter sp.]
MKRKHFLQSVFPAGFLLTDGLQVTLDEPWYAEPFQPPYLKAGDVISITSPAGYITEKEIQPAVQQIESWGLKVKIGSS